MSKSGYKYLYGPVPSRRLGRSLGVDLVPMKTCTQNCVYCQLGIDTQQTLERKEYVPVDEVLGEIEDFLASGKGADYITLSGSGEPTLNSRFGELIDSIHSMTTIPVAVITNGSLLSNEKVRNDCCKADLVMPSLDAADPETFNRINQPHHDIKFNGFLDGIKSFKKRYTGRFWLEIFLIEGINTSRDHLDRFKVLIDELRPDRVQLNTAVRPTADHSIKPIPHKRMEEIEEYLGGNVTVVGPYKPQDAAKLLMEDSGQILNMIKRRPCSIEDISSSLKINHAQVIKTIQLLQQAGAVVQEVRDDIIYYKVTEKH